MFFQVPVKLHKKITNDNQKKFTYRYFLNDTQLCKAVYCSILNINRGRVSYAIENKIQNGITSPDRRGKQESYRKLPVETLDKVRLFLDEFPKYKSRYTNGNKEYFSPELTVKKLHELFCEKHPECKIGFTRFNDQLKAYNVSIYYKWRPPSLGELTPY